MDDKTTKDRIVDSGLHGGPPPSNYDPSNSAHYQAFMQGKHNQKIANQKPYFPSFGSDVSGSSFSGPTDWKGVFKGTGKVLAYAVAGSALYYGDPYIQVFFKNLPVLPAVIIVGAIAGFKLAKALTRRSNKNTEVKSENNKVPTDPQNKVARKLTLFTIIKHTVSSYIFYKVVESALYVEPVILPIIMAVSGVSGFGLAKTIIPRSRQNPKSFR